MERITKSITISLETEQIIIENKEKLDGNISAICENAIRIFCGKPATHNIKHKSIENTKDERAEYLNSYEFKDDISVRICKDHKVTQGCADKILNMHGLKFSTDELIEEAHKIHGDKLDKKPMPKITPRKNIFKGLPGKHNTPCMS